MRKTLIAMVGLLALGLWALPALAGDYDLPKVSELAPPENRAGRLGAIARGDEASYQGTLSGTLIKQSQAVTTWYLYPNACNERLAGTWAPSTTIAADSLNTYSTTVVDHGYFLDDHSLKEILWHITDGGETPGANYDPIIAGARSLWCGKYDANFAVPVGYPNQTYQILYLDTGTHAGSWTLSWLQNVSTEFNYDYLYIIGGTGGAADPIGNSRVILDHIIQSGSDAAGELLLTQTGSQVAAINASYLTPPGVLVNGAGAGQPATVTGSLGGIPAQFRAIYLLFTADCLWSNEDGLWPEGHGQILDLVSASDNGVLFDEDPIVNIGIDAFAGNVLKGTTGAPLISARVAPGVGELWRINSGNNLPNSDFCNVQKTTSIDHMFEAGDASTHFTIAGTYASIRTCTLPVPPGTASIIDRWDEYLDLPRQSGFVQSGEFRFFKEGSWSGWANVRPAGGVITGAPQAWTFDFEELAAATSADSIQMRYQLQCIPTFAIDDVNCQPVLYGILYDNLRVQILTGVPAPVFGIFVGSVAQSHFVDGTDPASTNCSPALIAAGRCWPGVRGSALTPSQGGVYDNFNSGYVDSVVAALVTGLRKNGMGVNWRYGFDKTVVHDGVGARKIARINGAYNPAYDVPRIIYRMYDPATTTWSPWDSSELDATSVTVRATDTMLVDNEFRVNWPPRDKYYVNVGGGDIGPNADADLPGAPGWTMNGNTKYGQIPFLPRGSRIQYYFKAVDILGGVSYQFQTDNAGLEVVDLPTLPGSSIKAPDIIEMDVLPAKYPAGAAGSLAAGKTDADVLNLDGAYSVWPNTLDAMTQTLRAMGVRADRLRRLQGLGNGSAIGGHELPGQRQDRLSNYFPNVHEYNITGLLADSYRILIESSQTRTSTIFDEQDAILVENWWNTKTGALNNDGDRCIFVSGDDTFNALLNASLSFPQFAQQVSLAQNVFGVASVLNAWSNPLARQYPTIDDRFAGGGPGLAAPNTFTYPIDGGCPAPNRFDGMTKIGSGDAQNAAIYPDGVTEVAAVSRMSEKDAGGDVDNDRNKALAYGYSISFIRTAGIPTNAANYVRSGVENRMRVMYKFLTSCRRNTGAVATPCWPCPSSASEMSVNWATAAGFQTGTYGDLYPIQDHTTATGVELVSAPAVNRLEGAAPNPFNPETAIRFSAATPGKVTIRIFDVSGRLVNTLSKNVTETGLQEIRWNGKASDGRQLSSGMYFFRVHFPNGQQSEAKATMLK